MSVLQRGVRRPTAVALTSLSLVIAVMASLPLAANAEPLVVFDEDRGIFIVTELEASTLEAFENDVGMVILQLQGAESQRGMLVSSSAENGELHVQPRFSLSQGETYRLALSANDEIIFESNFATVTEEVVIPRLTAFSPSHRFVPENTLRFYLTFSEPMAAGQVRDHVSLQFADGTPVESPFLNLATELWDAEQRRLTLLLDPGRIKQGVGPNLQGGPPLVEGNDYRLVVAGDMASASGQPLGEDVSAHFSVSSPQITAIDPSLWSIVPPQPGTREPFFVSFDRVMDQATVQRLLWIEDMSGEAVRGSIVSDGTMWTLTPQQPWSVGTYQLVAEPNLEDVAGNTIRSAFDAGNGTIGTTDLQPSFTPFEVR
ncbi:MAG: Ig-like domain-containing protein [Pseudomonadota bacterium]